MCIKYLQHFQSSKLSNFSSFFFFSFFLFSFFPFKSELQFPFEMMTKATKKRERKRKERRRKRARKSFPPPDFFLTPTLLNFVLFGIPFLSFYFFLSIPFYLSSSFFIFLSFFLSYFSVYLFSNFSFLFSMNHFCFWSVQLMLSLQGFFFFFLSLPSSFFLSLEKRMERN